MPERMVLAPMTVTGYGATVKITPGDAIAYSEIADAILLHFGQQRATGDDVSVRNPARWGGWVHVKIAGTPSIFDLCQAAEMYAIPHGYDYTVEVTWRSVAGASAETTNDTALAEAAGRATADALRLAGR